MSQYRTVLEEPSGIELSDVVDTSGLENVDGDAQCTPARDAAWLRRPVFDLHSQQATLATHTELPETAKIIHSGRNLSAPVADTDGSASGPQTARSEASGHADDASHSATVQPRTLLQTFTIMISICACVFVAALEATVVATAMPAIAAHFASPNGYTWVGTAYILAHAASTPPWGKLSDIWGRKPLLLTSAAIFFAGSLLCAIIDDFSAFIAARALQGLGAGGMQTITNICISDLFSQRDRGMWYGLLSIIWALASAVGPVFGGVFTTKLSWRWCFWLNLPITGIAFLLLLFTLKLPSPKTPIMAGLKAVDWSGTLLIVGGAVMLLLGLHLGGVQQPWHSPAVISLLAFGAFAGAIFVLNEWKLAVYPIIPPRLFKTWSSSAAYAVCFFHAYAFMGVGYYLPLYCQSVLLTTPLKAGIYMLPFILSISITAALTGVYIQASGRYMPAVYVGLATMTLGLGLLINVGPDINWAKLVCFQLIAGVGVGMNFEGPLLAVQAVVASRDVATATAAMSFVRTMATAISVVIGGVVFQNEMASHRQTLEHTFGAGIADRLSGAEATSSVGFVRTLPDEKRLVARAAFYDAIRSMWVMYTVFSAVGLLLGFFIRGHHLSKDHEEAQLGIDTAQDAAGRMQSEAPRTSGPNRASARMRRIPPASSAVAPEPTT